jgi:hypothetical protein
MQVAEAVALGVLMVIPEVMQVLVEAEAEVGVVISHSMQVVVMEPRPEKVAQSILAEVEEGQAVTMHNTIHQALVAQVYVY